MKIRKGGITRHVSKRAFNRKWKDAGFEKVEEVEENDNELQDMSHQEIYEIAQEYGIDGRSKMDKQELIQAIEGVE